MTEHTSTCRISQDARQKSVSGQLFYIYSLSRYCEGFWESLRDTVLYPCEFFARRAKGHPTSDAMHDAADACLARWISDWGIDDEWLIIAAQHTLTSWAVLENEAGPGALDTGPLSTWYGPSEAILAAALDVFNPVFEQPYPKPLEALSDHDRSILAAEPVGLRMYEAGVRRESVAEFKKRMKIQFDAQLADYAVRSEKQILEQRNIRRDATWTALYQCRLSPKAIEAWEFKRSGDAFSYTRIQQAVKKFAASIGLTLRKPKAGRYSKRTGIQPQHRL